MHPELQRVDVPGSWGCHLIDGDGGKGKGFVREHGEVGSIHLCVGLPCHPETKITNMCMAGLRLNSIKSYPPI